MAQTPTQVANLALDAVGINQQLGNIEEGGRVPNLCLRAYGKCFRDLMRGAPWGFARKQVPLLLLADSSGSTANVRTTVPGTEFQYEYAYPIDCARVRYIPWNPLLTPATPAGNIVPPNPGAPLTSATQQNPRGQPLRPSQFLVTNDPNIPVQPNQSGFSQAGQSPTGSTVILSNVPKASCVYTFEAVYPSLWDALFTGAMVGYLASEIAFPLWSDKNARLGLQLRVQQVAIAKEKIGAARVADGNEMTTSSDISVDWMRFRNTGGSGLSGSGLSDGGGGWGCWGGGWGGSVGFADGTSY